MLDYGETSRLNKHYCGVRGKVTLRVRRARTVLARAGCSPEGRRCRLAVEMGDPVLGWEGRRRTWGRGGGGRGRPRAGGGGGGGRGVGGGGAGGVVGNNLMHQVDRDVGVRQAVL